ncbi:hypothetical protein HPB47_005709, partial [Ixodes persulcatus]
MWDSERREGKTSQGGNQAEGTDAGFFEPILPVFGQGGVSGPAPGLSAGASSRAGPGTGLRSGASSRAGPGPGPIRGESLRAGPGSGCFFKRCVGSAAQEQALATQRRNLELRLASGREDERMMDHEAELEAAINLSTAQATTAVRAQSATPTTNGVLHEDVADATPQ